MAIRKQIAPYGGERIRVSISGFWLKPTWPQYNKIVKGEEMCLDGTETSETEIVKYEVSDNYKKWCKALMQEAMKKPNSI